MQDLRSKGLEGDTEESNARRHGLVRPAIVGIAIAAAGFVLAGTAAAGPTPKPSPTTSAATSTTTTSSTGQSKTFITSSLLDAATANPDATFDVVVQGHRTDSTAMVESHVAGVAKSHPSRAAKGIKTKYAKALNGLSAQLTGKQIVKLVENGRVASIVSDAPVAFTDLTNTQLWPAVTQVTAGWTSLLPAPAIAIVDTGIDASRTADFGNRVLAEIDMTPGRNNSAGDGRGHGTMVAGIAAGSAVGFAGAAPGAPIVSIDVMDDDGTGRMSDVVAAADWILLNKDRYGIRVANFSLHGSSVSSFQYDPVCQAVERLWLNSVVVVAAAGNYGNADAASGVLYAPGNDPFVITVGAADTLGTLGFADDFAAPWSAHGYTVDGFAKPELGAPGRFMNGPVPPSSTMYAERPERVIAPGYMWMSGTSFAAPIVAGAAAQILAVHPEWTPDQVKGALMVTARPAAAAVGFSLGVGEVQAADAVAVVNPPDPNGGLSSFVVVGADGSRVFDAASWNSAANADASWNSASWNSASWNSASWNSASWNSASWNSASWNSASWSSGQAPDGSFPAASWTSATSVS